MRLQSFISHRALAASVLTGIAPMTGMAEPPVARALPVEETAAPAEPPPATPPADAKAADDEPVREGKPVPKEGKAAFKDLEQKYGVPGDPTAPKPETIREGRAVTTLPGDKQTAKPAKETQPLAGSLRTQADARTLFISLPAPRGQIVDRNGVPLAQNIIAHYPGIEFPQGPQLKPEEAVRYARQRIPLVVRGLNVEWTISDEDIAEHYVNRRWLPLLCPTILKGIDVAATKSRLPSGVILHPAYIRHYPKGDLGCHWLGYVGKVRPMPRGPLDPLDPYYPEQEGREGLEKAFEKQLTGKPGQLNLLFDPQGNKLAEEITQKPVPGGTVVTTIDSDFQAAAEEVLKEHVKRGAFVMVDCRDGDVVVMASWPMFTPGHFVPSIPSAEYKKLLSDKDQPLNGRAFLGVYPPASTFKVVTALAGLDAGKLKEGTVFHCGSGYTIGDRVFHNWNRSDEGDLNLVSAIKRSCNTWFYQAGQITGAKALTSMASRLGYGERTGLPLRGEAPGLVATDDWMMRTQGHKIHAGILASMSIGQGPVSATPLQVARAMAAIGNGEFVPQLRLVSQVQDLDNRIVEAFPPMHRNELNLDSDYIKAVHKGMRAVVEDDGGTGKAAANKYVTVAGKTGTAQWGTDRHMAWFAGFVPAKNPQYAYAAIYEGDIGEDGISGGRRVAPLVSDALTKIYRLKKDRNESLTGPVLASSDKKKKKKDGEDEDETDVKPGADEDEDAAEKPVVAKARPAKPVRKEQATPEPPEPKAEGGFRGFLKRIFR